MDTIQLDVFDVQLGAAFLLQFRQDDGAVVRVLADGGSPHHDRDNYPPGLVLSQLGEAFSAFGGDDRRLDLIVGTHYDSDHLTGLTPIVADESMEIGEAWLPPVVNDTVPTASSSRVRSHDFLAHQMAQTEGDEVLNRYRAVKSEICERIQKMELGLVGEEHISREVDKGAGQRRSDEFERHILDVRRILGAGGVVLDEHGSHETGDDNEERAASRLHLAWDSRLVVDKLDWLVRKQSVAEREVLRKELALVRAAEAKKAINAKALNGLVKAFVARQIPMSFRFIEPGRPAMFGWRQKDRRFVPTNAQVAHQISLNLIGPSRALIDKHREIIPSGRYSAKLALQVMGLANVTPSNQLSYALVFQSTGQRMLISGDTGFDDFKPSRHAPYFEGLLEALRPLHVVQVSHHGGANSHFYRVLEAAGLHSQDQDAYLTVSHATDDRHRPSATFDDFIGRMRRPADHLRLVFTGRADKERVKNFRDLIVPSTEASGKDRGNARLTYDKKWHVDRHPVGY